MSSDRNLIAGVANSLWSAALSVAVVPLYLKYLGMEAYGLIAFFTSAQALLSLLDMGLAPTMNREVARCSAKNNFDEARALLHSLSVLYWTSAAVIGIAMAVLAPFLASRWLHATSMSQESVTGAIILMGIVFACRWPIGIYQGAVIGAQKLVVSSIINIVMVTIASLGAVVLLAFVAPRIEVYFVWQAIVGMAYALAMRAAAWNALGKPSRRKFDVDGLRRVWRFSAGMSGVAISGAVLMQLDKILLSRLLSLEAFGAYALAGTLSSGLYILLTPTFNVIYPRLSRMVMFYGVGTRFLLAFLFPLAGFVSVYSNEILILWIHDLAIAARAAPIVSIFVLGTALNGAMHFPYALQLAYGITKLPLTINAILLSFTVPTTIFLAYKFGAVGGAFSWAIINALYVAVGTWLTHKTVLRGIGLKWLALDVGIPLILTILVVGGISLIARSYTNRIGLLLGVGSLSCMAGTVLILFTSTNGRTLLLSLAHGKRPQLDGV
jgi:O-antigen/teichoic acid export membrane protein